MESSIFSTTGPDDSVQTKPAFDFDSIDVSTALDSPPALESRPIDIAKPIEPESGGDDLTFKPETDNLPAPNVVPTVTESSDNKSWTPTNDAGENIKPFLEESFKHLEDVITQNSQNSIEKLEKVVSTSNETVKPIVVQTTGLIEQTKEVQKEVAELIDKTNNISDLSKTSVVDKSQTDHTETVNSVMGIIELAKEKELVKEKTNNTKELVKEKTNNTKETVFANTQPAINSTNIGGSTIENKNQQFNNQTNEANISNQPISVTDEANISNQPISVTDEANQSPVVLERTNMEHVKPSAGAVSQPIKEAITTALKEAQGSGNPIFNTNVQSQTGKNESSKTNKEIIRELESSRTESKTETKHQPIDLSSLEGHGEMHTTLLVAIYEALASGTLKVRLES